MKKLLLPLLALCMLASCEKDNEADLNPTTKIEEAGFAKGKKSNKVDVCHKGKIINVNGNAVSAHQGHGDAVDLDGDGYFDIDNPCSETDCDDTSYDPENSCCEGYEIDSDGPLYVALADEAGSYTWEDAIEACAAKALADGCGWRLPNFDELVDMFAERNNIGGFDQSGVIPDALYWSSDPVEGAPWIIKVMEFDIGGIGSAASPDNSILCRCVRR